MSCLAMLRRVYHVQPLFFMRMRTNFVARLSTTHEHALVLDGLTEKATSGYGH
jgi:hypothetical protein